MDRIALVNFDIEAGREIIDALDTAGLRPKVALWAILDEYGDSRLILASNKLDSTNLRKVDQEVLDALLNAHVDAEDAFSVLTFRMSDRFIRELRTRYAGRLPRGAKLGGQSFGGKYVEDAFVYRIE